MKVGERQWTRTAKTIYNESAEPHVQDVHGELRLAKLELVDGMTNRRFLVLILSLRMWCRAATFRSCVRI